MKKCNQGKGYACGDTCISVRYECRKKAGASGSGVASSMTDKIKSVSFNFDELLAEGAYGTVKIDRVNNVVQKTLKDRNLADGSPNTFGEYEVHIGKMMGDAGYGPKIYSSSADEIVMDVVQGSTLWADFRQNPDLEPESMDLAAAKSAMRALSYLHKSGYAHGDNHVLQYIINGDKVKLIDFGLSKPINDDPKLALQDWSKMWKAFGGDRFANDAEFASTVKIVQEYREITGSSKKAKAAKADVIAKYQEYIK